MDETMVRAIVESIIKPIIETIRKDIEELYKRTNSSEIWQARYGEKIDKIERLVEKSSEALTQRWNNIVTSIIIGVIMLVAGYLFGKLTGK
jgi:large-conductance mechanosensitive channel